MTPKPIIFATDLHGRRLGFKAVMEHASANGIDRVVFGGDINPKRYFLRFKDGIIVPDNLMPKGPPQTIGPDEWFRSILEYNKDGPQAGRPGEGRLVDASYVVDIRRNFREMAARFERLCRYLRNHVADGRVYLGTLSSESQASLLRTESKLSYKLVHKPEGQEARELNEEIIPLIRKRMFRWIARSASDEEMLDAYLRSAGGFPQPPHDGTLWKNIFYRSMPDAIKKAFRMESSAILKMMEEWDSAGMKPHNVERGQLGWMRNDLLPEIAAFVNGGEGRAAFIMPGNDDISKTLLALEKAEAKGILTQIHGKVVSLGDGYSIGGYSYVSNLPLPLMQDWQKDEEGIRADLNAQFGSCDQRRTVLSFHVPPVNGLLDLNYKGVHIGSEAVREYIASSAHPLALTGHVHEIVTKWGNWKEQIGDTLVMTPGASHENGIDVLIVNPAEPENAVRIKIR